MLSSWKTLDLGLKPLLDKLFFLFGLLSTDDSFLKGECCCIDGEFECFLELIPFLTGLIELGSGTLLLDFSNSIASTDPYDLTPLGLLPPAPVAFEF